MITLQDLYTFITTRAIECNGYHSFSSSTGTVPYLQKNGVYFFFDPSEPPNCPAFQEYGRIVRVGSHNCNPKAPNTRTLRERLNGHWGNSKDGAGNHRGSVFRKHVGLALFNRAEQPSFQWGVGSSASATIRQSEKPHEQAVSNYIRMLSFTYFHIDYICQRKYWEEWSIALLAQATRANQIQIGKDWLGRYADGKYAQCIVTSGLWNVDNINDELNSLTVPNVHALL